MSQFYVNIASGSGGTVTPANGGTGVSNPTSHTLPVAEGAAPFNFLGPLTNGQLLIGSTGADPVPATLTAGTNVTITNGAGTITINADPASQTVNYTAVSTSPYVVLTTDYYLGVTSSGGAIQVNLPNAPATGRVFIVKDTAGSAVTHNITITTVGGIVTIDGATSYVMATNFQAVSLIFNGTSYEVF